MRKTLIAMAALFMAASTAQAADLAPGLSLDTEVKAFRTVDAERNQITIEPELRWVPTVDGPLSLTVSSLVSAYDSSAADSVTLLDTLEEGSRPNIDFGAYYQINANATVYGETSWDIDAEDRTDIEVGVSFKF